MGNFAKEGAGIHAGEGTQIIGNRIIGNSTVTNELGYGNGGGIYGSRAVIEGNVIAGNAARNSNQSAEPAGGGIFVAGGYAYSGSIVGNVIAWNLAEYGGGGIGCYNVSPQICGNKVLNNHAVKFGGGMDIRDFSKPLVSNNLVAQNTAGLGGGGLWFQNINAKPDEEPGVINNTIVQNSAGGGLPDYVGGGIGCYSGGAANIVNCILWGNVCGNGSQLGLADSKAVVSHSDLAGGQAAVYVVNSTLVWQDGNIAADPMFIGPDDYRLDWQSNPISPCIDKCPTGTIDDIRGYARPFDGDGITNYEYDMGAYEMQGNDTESTIIYADGDLGDTIQAAIDSATDGTTIIVKDGTYTGPGNYDITCKGKVLTIQSENGPAACIVDCQQNGRGFRFDWGEQAATVLDGFTIKNGRSDRGGAIYCLNASPVIRNCILTGNRATSRGGAVYIAGGSPSIKNTIIVQNTAEKEAGADNEAHGGGIAFEGSVFFDPETIGLANLTIGDNSAYTGGAVCLEQRASVVLRNCILWNNEATGLSGQEEIALYSSGGGSTLTMKYCDARGGSDQYVEQGSTLNWSSAPGEANINADPLFLGLAPHQYTMKGNSPCINTGTTTGAPTTDICGTTRPTGPATEMGAYEFPWPIPGDCNLDCRVNILDLIFIRNKLNQSISDGNNWQANALIDTRINILDLIFVRTRLNTHCTQ